MGKTVFNQKLDYLLREVVKPLLKSNSFKIRGNNFYRYFPSSFQLINLQRSQFNIGSEGKFTFNIGIQFLDEGTEKFSWEPRTYECQFNNRIGEFIDDIANFDYWWHITEYTDIEIIKGDLKRVFEEYVLAKLAVFESEETLFREVENNPQVLGKIEVVPVVRLFLKRGKKDEAIRMLESLMDYYKRLITKCTNEIARKSIEDFASGYLGGLKQSLIAGEDV